MGRQIAIAMQQEDEESFLAFLLSNANVVLHRSWSPSPEQVAGFTQDPSASLFWVHNLTFESPRVLRRLNTLRGLSHEQVEQILTRGA